MSFILLLISFASPCEDGRYGCRKCQNSRSCSECISPNYKMIRGIDGTNWCVCNSDAHYYGQNCELAVKCDTTSSVPFCDYCLKRECVECNRERHLVLLDDKTCGCDSRYHLEDGIEEYTCQCQGGYAFNIKGECETIDYTGKNGGDGCIESLPTYNTCIQCKEHFQLTTDFNPYCICEDGYMYDRYIPNSNEKRCIKLFPNECREGCICDQDNQNCLSCNENYIPEYYSDLSTIANCIPTYECTDNALENCIRCNKDQECIQCKEGLFYVPSLNKCVERTISTTERNFQGCIYAEGKQCFLCEKEYTVAGRYGCTLNSPSAISSLYANIKEMNFETNVWSKNDDQITFNLDQIKDTQNRPYKYEIYSDELTLKTILINNDNSIDFALGLVTIDEAYVIRSLDGSKPDPRITIFGYDLKLDFQTKKASLYDIHSCEITTNNDKIELDKVTLDDYVTKFIVSKSVQINEIDCFYHGLEGMEIQPQTRDGNELEIHITTLNIHLGKDFNILNNVEIDTVNIEAGGELKSDFKLTVHNLHVKMPAAHIDRTSTYFIYGNILGVPESITIDLNPNDTFVWQFDQDFPTLGLVRGNSQEFVQNCDKWAKVYNDHPTDGIYNFAQCIKYDEQFAMLEITHSDKKPGDGDGDSNAGMIAGIVVGVIVVIAVVIVLLYFFVIKPRQANKNNSSANEDNNKENEAEVA